MSNNSLQLKRTSAIVFALLILAAAMIVSGSLFANGRSAFSSSELRYFEHSQSGLQIVPASCPSSPHYAGECDSSCAAQYYCSGDELWFRNQACQTQLIEVCTEGCSGQSCNNSGSNLSLDIRVVPGLVRSGNTTQVIWTSTNAASCAVSENNPNITNAWTGTSGTQTSGAIEQQTIYTLACVGLDGNTYYDTAKVNVIPVFCETTAEGCPED